MAYASIEDKRENQRRWYRRNKEAMVAKAERQKQAIRAAIADAKAGGACACGESRTPCLDFHHRSEEVKEFCIGNAAALGTGLKRLAAEIAKCDLICANCHRVLHSDARSGIV